LAGGVLAVACSVVPVAAAGVRYPVGSSIGLAPPPGLRPVGTAPGFYDPDNKASIALLELPFAAYAQAANAMTTAAAKARGIAVDLRETLFTDAGAALVSAGEDSQQKMRKWMMVVSLPRFTALVTVQIPDAARAHYPDSSIRDALASLTVRPEPITEELGLLPYKLGDLAGFRVVTILNRSTVILTEGPSDESRVVDQPHLVVSIGPGAPTEANDRARLAHIAFDRVPGFVNRRITTSEMLRVDGHPVYEIRADARDAATGADVAALQWLWFGRNAFLQIFGVTAKDHWNRDFPRFRAIRDGIQPRG
jgi:hypothetical protein